MADKVWEILVEGSGASTQAPDLEEVRRALAVLADPEHGVQLQYAPFHKESFQTFLSTDLDGACSWVDREGRGATGIYYGLNPVPPGLEHSMLVADVLRRRWLLVDIDRDKSHAPDDSATEEEHEQARALALDVRDTLDGLSWPAPLLVDSGNGFHLLYRIDLDCGEPGKCSSQKLVKAVLARLAERFDGERGTIGAECHDARRIAKLPGTWARRGNQTTRRPWRLCRLLHLPGEVQVVGEALLRGLAEMPTPPVDQVEIETLHEFSIPVTSGNEARYARSAFERECGRLALAPRGKLNKTAYKAAAALGNFVGAGLLDEEEVFQALLRALQSAGGNNPRKDENVIRRGLEKGKAVPRIVPTAVGPAPSQNGKMALQVEQIPDVNPDDVATIDDLIVAGAQVSWLWEGWIPDGVLTALAALGGVGKTRFCADLLRRIRHGLPWPDGAPMLLPVDALALWVVADNHHDQLVEIAESFDIKANIRINATKADPYGGVTLEEPSDYRDLEARIKAVRPELVIVDTVGNSTDKNLSRQEEAKAYYQPLQIIARRYRCAILCLTHLNASGQFLGRRVQEKVRVAIKMEQFEEQGERIRLEVKKSFSRRPAPLGMTMGDAAVEYDTNPPESPILDPGTGTGRARSRTGPPSLQLQACMGWLREQLQNGPVRVSVLRDRSENAGHSTPTLYRARDALGAVEFLTEGRKWWRLTSDEEEC